MVWRENFCWCCVFFDANGFLRHPSVLTRCICDFDCGFDSTNIRFALVHCFSFQSKLSESKHANCFLSFPVHKLFFFNYFSRFAFCHFLYHYFYRFFSSFICFKRFTVVQTLLTNVFPLSIHFRYVCVCLLSDQIKLICCEMHLIRSLSWCFFSKLNIYTCNVVAYADFLRFRPEKEIRKRKELIKCIWWKFFLLEKNWKNGHG